MASEYDIFKNCRFRTRYFTKMGKVFRDMTAGKQARISPLIANELKYHKKSEK